MKVVLQRVSEASVRINNEVYNSIKTGLVVLLGITEDDNQNDIDWLVKKIINLRIFEDENRIMNLSLKDINGDVLLISQFTLFASTKKGNRPSYIKASKPEVAIPLYEKFITDLETFYGNKIATGKFGADMKVSLVNNGPVTIIIDSKDRQ
jgi:D-tyrosyl-tRNA(Tyr) deacylase